MAAILWFLAAPAFGQTRAPSETDKEQARRLVALGDERFARGDYRGALDAYRGAELVVAVPTTTLQVARAQVALRQLREARATLRGVLARGGVADEPAGFRAARERAARLTGELGRRIPTLSVELTGVPARSSAWLTVDGVTWAREQLAQPQQMNPGDHALIVWLDGREALTRRLRLDEGDREVLRVEVPPATRAGEERPVSPLVYVGFGVAGAGVVVGAVTGALSLARAAGVKDACFSDDLCPRSIQPVQQESVTLAHVSTASFATAGAGAIVGLVALFATDSDAASPPIDPVVGPLAFGLRGRF